jgi:tetratricopeptide (TPR) repeat protein
LVTDPERKELYNLLGYLCMYLGRRDEGWAALQRYAQLAPNDPNAYDGLGSFHQWFGAYEQAAAAFGQALALNPESHVAIIHLGNLYARQGRYTAALEQYRRYVQVARIDAQRARGYNYQAWVWLRKGALAEAEAAAAQEKKYGGARPLWTPVELALRRGDQTAAARLAEPHFAPAEYESYKGRSHLRIYYYLRGSFVWQTGRANEAVEHFREAMRHQATEWHVDSFEDCLANYPLAHYHLGQAYERKDDRMRARAAYERFLQVWKEADADIPEVIEAKARLAGK